MVEERGVEPKRVVLMPWWESFWNWGRAWMGAISKAVEGMDLESYNKSQGLGSVINRLTRAVLGKAKEVMNIAYVTGIEGSEVNYKPD